MASNADRIDVLIASGLEEIDRREHLAGLVALDELGIGFVTPGGGQGVAVSSPMDGVGRP